MVSTQKNWRYPNAGKETNVNTGVFLEFTYEFSDMAYLGLRIRYFHRGRIVAKLHGGAHQCVGYRWSGVLGGIIDRLGSGWAFQRNYIGRSIGRFLSYSFGPWGRLR